MLDVLGRETIWTDEREDFLRARWKDGATAAAIARMLACGISRSAVIGKAHRLKLEKRAPAMGPRPRISDVERNIRRNERLRLYRRNRSIRLRQHEVTPEPIAHDTALEFLHKQLMELARTDCRFPQGEGPYAFCGQPARPGGSSYCQHHHLRVYQGGR